MGSEAHLRVKEWQSAERLLLLSVICWPLGKGLAFTGATTVETVEVVRGSSWIFVDLTKQLVTPPFSWVRWKAREFLAWTQDRMQRWELGSPKWQLGCLRAPVRGESEF